jgi:hypothetical protein
MEGELPSWGESCQTASGQENPNAGHYNLRRDRPEPERRLITHSKRRVQCLWHCTADPITEAIRYFMVAFCE